MNDGLRHVGHLAVAVLLTLAVGPVAAQTGGTQSIFTAGVGARALGLGNAFVAMPDDPTAIYWNPGALDLLQRRSATLFYSNLLVGASYSFVGYVHPTLSLGTFGIGWARVGVGDVHARDERNVSEGNISFSHDEFLFAFSKQLPYSVTVGVAAKIDRQVLWQFSDSGMGADLGLVWEPSLPEATLSGLTVGLAIQNAIAPTTRLVEEANYLSHNVRFGLALPVGLEELRGRIRLYLDLEKGDRLSTRFHLGSEYLYSERAALRFGLNNGELSFGAGYIQGNFRLDYSYGRFFDNELSPSHRFSFTVEFGKTREEIARLIEERQAREMEELARREVEWQRRETIDRSLREGRQYLSEKNYYAAYREFVRVLALDPENPEAQTLAKQADERIGQQLEVEITEKLEKDQQERLRAEQERFAKEHLGKGKAFLETGDYLQALKEFQTILSEQPDNDVAKKWIEEIHKEIDKQIEELARQADDLVRSDKRRAAVAKLREAQRLAADRPDVVQFLQGKINFIEAQLDFSSSFQQGIRYYAQKDYKAAMNAFERAVRLQPNNAEVRRWYDDAKSRAFAKDEPLTPEVNSKYLQGFDYFVNGDYEKALELWEECHRLQPYSKKILDAIDQARDKLRKK